MSSLPSDEQKNQATAWFSSLQSDICLALENLEKAYGDHLGKTTPPPCFQKKTWNRDGGGGGVISVLAGELFEKAGVNVSTVHGTFSEEMQQHIPGAKESPTFWASGISLVIHPKSPHVPIIHMNTRHIITTLHWFGGGIDLTPAIIYDDDKTFFHQALQDVCDGFDTTYYPRFKAWADTYFYLPHRQEARGVGGIFYDNLNTSNWDADWAYTQAVGKAFSPLYQEIVQRRWHLPWSEKEKQIQLQKRGRYAEFNLIYDRGTQFGLKTGGNIEAIFMSLPPQAEWPLAL